MSSIASPISALTRARDLPQRLSAAIREGHTGASIRAKMAPELSYGRYRGPAPPTARQAAVILLLIQRDGRWHVPLTERPLHLAHHAGQISLPGGAVEVGESTAQAAIRELREEIGFSGSIGILGPLAECYVFASDYLVVPWLASTREEPHWTLDEREVARVIELPLEVLLDASSIGQLKVERGPRVFHAPCIRVGSARVWGATCMILGELAGLLQQISETRI